MSSAAGKGKGKEVAGKDSYGGKRKRDKDDDKTGRNGKNRGVLQFFDDEAGDAGGYDSSDDSLFSNGVFDKIFGSYMETNEGPEMTQFVPFEPKEEEMSEQEFDKMMAERYKSGSGAVTHAEDSYNKQRSVHIDSTVSFGKDPVIWKLKCAIGRERHSVFCLMQKFVELRALGTKLQIISAISLDHVKGYVFVEAEKQADVNEACKGLCNIYLSRTSKVAANELSQLLSTRNKQNIISEGTWARVKSGTYKGDLGQVVAVNDARKRATVKLIPRIDLQVLAQKFGGGGASKRSAAPPPPRLIGLSELEEFRPLIQVRRDNDTNLVFQVLDGLLLKDGYLYKKVPLDSLSFSGVSPSEDEILKFNPSEKRESNDLEWLSQLYGGREKKRPMKSLKGSDKGGGKGEGSSSSPSIPSGYEIHDLVCFGRKDFGIILGFEKDNCKILKDAPEGPVVVTVDPQQLTTALSDTKFTALDHKKKTLSLGDTVKVVEGPSQGRQGNVKQIYRGVVFLTDDNEENDGYFCAKSFMCEKVKLFEDTFQPGEEGACGFTDFPSSPKSHMPGERTRDFGRHSKDDMFSVGQTLRIRVGPLKGYLCRVLAIRYSDITVKLNSQTKIFTVKSEHLSEVRKTSTISAGDDLDSKPSELLGNLDPSGGWIDGMGTSSDSNAWNVSGATTERSGWASFPATEAATSEPHKENHSSSWDNHPKADATGLGSGTATVQNSTWGGWGQKKPEDGEVSESTWGQSAAPMEDAAGWENKTTLNQSSGWGGWGSKKPEDNGSEDTEALGSSWRKDAGPSSDSQKDCTAGWGNKTSGSENSTWGGWGKKADQDGEIDPTTAPGSSWGNVANPSVDRCPGSAWGQKKQEDGSIVKASASGSWGKAAEVPRNSSEEGAASWGNQKAATHNSWGASEENKPKVVGGESPWNKETVQQNSAWGERKDVTENPSRIWGTEKNTDQNAPFSGGDEKASWVKQGSDSSWRKQDGESSVKSSGWVGQGNWGGGSAVTQTADQGGWGKKTSDGDQGGWGKKTSDGNQGGWSKKTSDGDQGGWGQKSSDGNPDGWGKKSSDGNPDGCSQKSSDENLGGWGKEISGGDQGGWAKKTSDGNRDGCSQKSSDGNSAGWGKKIYYGDQSGGSKKIAGEDQGGWNKKTTDGDQGGWNKKTTDGDQGGWSQKSSDGNSGGWGKKASDGDQSGWGKNASDGDQSGWGKKASDGDQSGWGKNASDGDQSGWGKKASDGDQSGWGKKASDGDQSDWGKKGSDGDQSSWGKKGSDGDQSSWGKKASDGDQSSWGKKASDGDQSGWGKKASDGDQSGWGKKASDGDWSKKSNWASGGSQTLESESGHSGYSARNNDWSNRGGGRGRFIEGGFRGGMGRSERGGFRGRGSFDRGGRRGAFGGRGGFGGRDGGNEGGSFKQRSWDNDQGRGWDNSTNSNNKAGWSNEHGSGSAGYSQTGQWGSGGGSRDVGLAEGNQPGGWGGGTKWNSTSGSKGTDGSSSQAGNWGRNDEAGGWKANSTSHEGCSKEPVKENVGSSVEASAADAPSTGWGNSNSGWNKGAGGSNAQTGNGGWN